MICQRPGSDRDVVLGFYETALNKKDVEKFKEFLSDTYTHNPSVADVKGLLLRLRGSPSLRQFPKSRNEVKAVTKGDVHALLMCTRVPGTPGANIVDILRVDGGEVEHWDAIQDICRGWLLQR